jgi:ATP synthase protein I
MDQLRAVGPWALAIATACVVVAGLTNGVAGVAGAAVAAAMVMVLFVSTPLVLGPITKVSPRLSLAVAMTFFVTKVVALVAAMTVLIDPDALGGHLDGRSLGLTLIVMTLAWTFLQVRAAQRVRLPLYDLPETTR